MKKRSLHLLNEHFSDECKAEFSIIPLKSIFYHGKSTIP